jgi:hypothetical protein
MGLFESISNAPPRTAFARETKYNMVVIKLYKSVAAALFERWANGDQSNA